MSCLLRSAAELDEQPRNALLQSVGDLERCVCEHQPSLRIHSSICSLYTRLRMLRLRLRDRLATVAVPGHAVDGGAAASC